MLADAVPLIIVVSGAVNYEKIFKYSELWKQVCVEIMSGEYNY